MTRSRGSLLVALLMLALAVLLAMSSATAQGDSKGLARKLELIREQMEQGQALYLKGDYSGAAKTFEQGFQHSPYSAFLFNAGVCYQKLTDYENALGKFRQYLTVDPEAPDTEKVRERIAALEAALAEAAAAEAAAAAAADAGDAGDAALDLDAGDAAPTDLDAGVPEAGVVLPPLGTDDDSAMKSLVVIETEPEGAPLTLYARTSDAAKPFAVGGENPGWQAIASRRSPTNLTLDVGRYHIVVEKYRDFNVSETDIDVAPGHVHHFKANLSQGAFMAFLRVSSNVRGAYIFLDDEKGAGLPWGNVPHGELVAPGKHKFRVEAPGFQPLLDEIELQAGEQKEMQAKLERVDYGFLRIDSEAPEIRVSLDGKPVGGWRSGETPLDVRATAGQHTLTVTGEGRKTFNGPVRVLGGYVLPVRVKLYPKYPRGAAWTQAIFSAAFIGAGIYLGTESNQLHDELEADREAGVLEEGDGRVTLGRWFSIGANASFVVGGVLAAVSTYNFVKDPIPESRYSTKEPLDFDDPRKARPSALVSRRRSNRAAALRKTPAPALRVAPSVAEQGGGLVVGGSF
ncbi:MAG TPA: PEGA domain-containing protein [Polyangiaceae bacterium]